MNSNLAYKFNEVKDIKIDQQKKIHNKNNNNQITIKLFGHKYKLRKSAKVFYENLIGWVMTVGIIVVLIQMAISLY